MILHAGFTFESDDFTTAGVCNALFIKITARVTFYHDAHYSIEGWEFDVIYDETQGIERSIKEFSANERRLLEDQIYSCIERLALEAIPDALEAPWKH